MSADLTRKSRGTRQGFEADEQASSGRACGILELALLHLFLACDAVRSPRHGVKPLCTDFFTAVDTFSETAFA